MDFEVEIGKIEKKYSSSNDFIYNLVFSKIEYIFNEQKVYEKIALVGGGKHTLHMLNDFGNCMERVDYIDKNSKECLVKRNFPQCQVYDYDKIHDYDCLIISSYEFETQIRDELHQNHYKGKIVCLYQELEKFKINLPTEYYNVSMYAYIPLIVARGLRENEQYRYDSLRYLIYMSIHNRDLLWAKKYLQEIIEAYPESTQREVDSLSELINIESELAQAFKRRKCRDIFAFWLDALRYELSLNLPFINKCRKRGVDYANFYANAFSTRHTYECILEKKDEMDVFNEKSNGNILASVLEQNGYDCYRASYDGAIKLEDFKYKDAKLLDDITPSTKLIWDAILEVLYSKKKSFILIHLFLETHNPYISPISSSWERYTVGSETWRLFSENNLKIYLQNALISAEYIDMELEYYLSIVLQNNVALLFADHGVNLTKQTAQYMEDLSHIPLCIVGNGIENKREEGLISTKRFSDIVESIIRNNNIEYSEYLQINGVDAYNKDWIHYIVDSGSFHIGMQYNGIRTLNDMLIINAAGEEFYYLLPNESDNEIDNPRYQGRIRFLRDKMIRKHINIYAYPKFKDSILLYEGQNKKFLWQN